MNISNQVHVTLTNFLYVLRKIIFLRKIILVLNGLAGWLILVLSYLAGWWS